MNRTVVLLLVLAVLAAGMTAAIVPGNSRRCQVWAVTIGTNMMGYTPVYGSSVKYVLLDRDELPLTERPVC